MLIRCRQCQALFSLQDGAAGTARSFKVECGRCLNVFDAAAAIQKPEKTPPPQQRLITPAPKAADPAVLERTATPGELAQALRPRRPGDEELRPPAKAGRRAALWIVAGIALAALAFGVTRLHLGGLSRAANQRMEKAREKLLRDDLVDLQEAAGLFTEAARLSPGEPQPEAERAFALLLQAATHKDLADRIDAAVRGAPPDEAARLLQEKVPHLRAQLRLLQEGLAAARAALEEDAGDEVALRALALHAAVAGTPEKGAQPLEQALQHAPEDAWSSWTRAALLVSGPPSREAQDRALAALAVAQKAEPRMLRAQVEVAAISIDRGESGPARTLLTQVLQANPRHERAQRLLALLPAAPQ